MHEGIIHEWLCVLCMACTYICKIDCIKRVQQTPLSIRLFCQLASCVPVCALQSLWAAQVRGKYRDIAHNLLSSSTALKRSSSMQGNLVSSSSIGRPFTDPARLFLVLLAISQNIYSIHSMRNWVQWYGKSTHSNHALRIITLSTRMEPILRAMGVLRRLSQ